MRFSAFVLTIFTSTLLAQPSPSYRVTHTYALGGDGSWDYIVPDPPSQRLYIARQNRVMVVDEDNGKLLGEVAGIQGAHGTAIAENTGHGFATSGDDQSVVMFDLKTFKMVVRYAEGRTNGCDNASARKVLRGRRPWHAWTLLAWEPGDLRFGHLQLSGGPCREGEEP
jgi:hypothetical protein